MLDLLSISVLLKMHKDANVITSRELLIRIHICSTVSQQLKRTQKKKLYHCPKDSYSLI